MSSKATEPEESGSSPAPMINAKDVEQGEAANVVLDETSSSGTKPTQKRLNNRLSFRDQDVQIPASPKGKEGNHQNRIEEDAEPEEAAENDNKRKSILRSFQSILNGASSKSNGQSMGPRSLSNTINMR